MDALPPWLQLDAMQAELAQLPEGITLAPASAIHPSADVRGSVDLGENSHILAGCVIEGPLRVGKNSSIGPNAYVRGGCIVGDNCRIGHAVELKASLVRAGSFISHLSYIGDSLLEEDVNLGGGCITCNFRHDAGEVRMPWKGVLHNTGRNKLGCHIGAHSRIGCNSSILPGTVLPESTHSSPGSVLRGSRPSCPENIST